MKHLIPALMIFVALSSLAPGSALAASPAPSSRDEPHPLVMQQAASAMAGAKVGTLTPFSAPPKLAAVGGSGGLRREVFGFALASSLSDPMRGYPSWNFSFLTTVAFFGLHLNDDGTFAADSGWSVWNSSQLSGLLSTAHSAGTKVVLTIILQDFSAGTPHMCAGLANRASIVSQTAAQVAAKGVDGVNVDFEGLNGSCPNGMTPRAMMTDLAGQLRAALPAGSYLSIDTYGSSAGDPAGFFDIPGLSPVVDSFFVMSYDAEYSNWSRAPTSCTSFCLGPTAPLSGYYYNDTSEMTQYTAAVPAAKVLLGVPYYGRKSCVAGPSPNQKPTGAVSADGYLDAIAESGASAVQPGSYAVHRDANDPAGQERWDTWYNTSLNCTRELYWDDTTSLGLKYDLVNRDQLRGVGIWNLNFGGSAPELWNELSTKFATTTPWQSLGGVLTSAPSAASWGPSRSDVVVGGVNNALWHGWRDGGAWQGWELLGGVANSDPSVVAWGSGRLDVFVRGTDNALWHKFWSGTWSNWESLGGVLTSGPAVASWTSNHLDVFVRGTDNALWHKSWSGVWSTWDSLGGVLTSDPAAVSWSSDRIDVFVRGTDQAMYHKWWTGHNWNGWENLGGVLTSAPAASSCAPGHIDTFYTGTSSSIYRLGYNGVGWDTWRSVDTGQWTSRAGAVCPPRTGVTNLVERGTDNAAWASTIAGS
jgi:spore germination protein YaaH